MRISSSIPAVLVVLGLLVLAGCQPGPALEPRTKVVETAPLKIDRIYHSMQGPFERIGVDHSDIDWLTAIRTEVIDDATDDPMGDEFFCHGQLQLFDHTRLMVTATGADEIRFPEGFALPVTRIMSRYKPEQQKLSFLGMVLNNHIADINKHGRIRASMEYLTDEDLQAAQAEPLKPLYIANLTMYVEDLEQWTPKDGPINEDVTTHCALLNGPAHWVVPPGEQITRKRFEPGWLPADGTVHYGWVHMHNYGVYTKLTDLTTGEVVWQADVTNEAERDQIAEISHYSSAEGFPVFRDHVYELEAKYDNTSDVDTDAMAMMSLFYYPSGGAEVTYASR